MPRIWISPEGEVFSTTREAAHLRQAERFVEERGYKTDGKTPVKTLLKNNWVRMSSWWGEPSGSGLEGRPGALEKHWDTITKFLQSDLVRMGKNAHAFIDVIGKDGSVDRIEEFDLGTLPFMEFREVLSRLRKRRGRSPLPRGNVYVRSYRRGGTK